MKATARASRQTDRRWDASARAVQEHPGHDAVESLQALAGNSAVTTLLDGGQPLDDPVRKRFGELFGQDLGSIRLHPDAPLPPDVLGCSVGEHIALGPAGAELDPTRSAAVLAHELAHVVQQRRGGPRVAPQPDAMEADANHAAAAAVRGAPAPVAAASAPVPAPLTRAEAQRKLWGLLPAPLQQRIEPLATEASTMLDKVVPPTAELPAPVAAVVDRSVEAAQAAAPLAKRAAAAVVSADRPKQTDTGRAAAVGEGFARDAAMRNLGRTKGVALEVGNVADVLIGLPAAWQWVAEQGIETAQAAGVVSPEHANELRAVITQSAASYEAATTWAQQHGLVEIDPITGSPSVSPVIGRQVDRLTDVTERAAFAEAALETPGIFTAYEAGELEGAIGSQVALGFVGVEEVQLAFKVVGVLGSVNGLAEEMQRVKGWRTSPQFWARVLGVVMSVIGLRNARASGKIVNLVIAAGTLTLAAAPLAQLHEHWTDPALAADPARREAVLKKDFGDVVKIVGQMIIDVVRQAAARKAAPPTPETRAPESSPPGTRVRGTPIAAPPTAPAGTAARPTMAVPRAAGRPARSLTDALGLTVDPGPALPVVPPGRPAAASQTAPARLRAATSSTAAAPVRRASSTSGVGPRGVRSRVGVKSPGAPAARRAPPRQRLGGATAEGIGAAFSYRRHGAVRTPPVEFVGRPGTPTRQLATLSKAPASYRIERVSLDPQSPHYWDRPGTGVVSQPGVVLEFPNGVRVWREQPGGPIMHEAPLRASIGRAGAERAHYTSTEHGALAPGPQYQRAHTLGQGTGFESPYGIYYAPALVNQLQNSGIETYLRSLAGLRRSGETFRVVTTTDAHPGTRRLSHVGYRIEAVVDGAVQEIASYPIDVGGTQERPVVRAGPIQFADNPLAREIQASVPQPPVITQPVNRVVNGLTPGQSNAPRRRIVEARPAAAQPEAAQPTEATVSDTSAAEPASGMAEEQPRIRIAARPGLHPATALEEEAAQGRGGPRVVHGPEEAEPSPQALQEAQELQELQDALERLEQEAKEGKRRSLRRE